MIRRIVHCTLVTLALVTSPAPGEVVTKDARPLGLLLLEGGRIVAASEKLVWVETPAGVYMCVIEINTRFEAALRYRKVRELYQNWPRSLCFNAASFE